MRWFIILAIWNEHQEKIDMAHKLLRSAQDKLEEQIKMRKEQVRVNNFLTYKLDCHIFFYNTLFLEKTTYEC